MTKASPSGRAIFDLLFFWAAAVAYDNAHSMWAVPRETYGQKPFEVAL